MKKPARNLNNEFEEFFRDTFNNPTNITEAGKREIKRVYYNGVFMALGLNSKQAANAKTDCAAWITEYVIAGFKDKPEEANELSNKS